MAVRVGPLDSWNCLKSLVLVPLASLPVFLPVHFRLVRPSAAQGGAGPLLGTQFSIAG
jgi:hypothetical protein